MNDYDIKKYQKEIDEYDQLKKEKEEQKRKVEEYFKEHKEEENDLPF